jgi:acetyl esterase/lipase
MRCDGPAFDASMQRQHIEGKPWAVFVHGGEFTWGSNIDQGYAILAAKMAAQGIGVLAVDYRTAPGANLPWDGSAQNTSWPAAVNDIIQAAEWLTLQRASAVSIFGDSSGGTQVLQALLMLAHRRRTGRPSPAVVASAMTFSAWLDLTCANPGYRTQAYCTANCLDAHSPDAGMHTAGWDAARGQCAALGYAGTLPLSHPLLSPAHAAADSSGLLGGGAWPPTMLIVGGSEILMPETLEFATAAQAAGAPVVARVYGGSRARPFEPLAPLRNVPLRRGARVSQERL